MTFAKYVTIDAVSCLEYNHQLPYSPSHPMIDECDLIYVCKREEKGRILTSESKPLSYTESPNLQNIPTREGIESARLLRVEKLDLSPRSTLW